MAGTLDSSLAQRLDLLEIRGRSHLAGIARAETLAAVRSWAAWGILIAGAVLLLARLSLPLGRVVALALALVIVGGAVLAAVVRTRRPPAPRLDALAVFDHRLGLKDRVVASDEFLDANDGFRRAALAEAEPWVDRALSTPLEAARAAPRRIGRSQWLAVALGIALLAVALIVSRPMAGGGGTAASSIDGRRMARPGDAARPDGASAMTGTAAGPRRDGIDGGATASDDPTAGRPAGAATRGATPATASAEGVPSAVGASPPSDGDADSSGRAGTSRPQDGGAAASSATSARLSARDLDGGSGGDALPTPSERGRNAAADAAAAQEREQTAPGRLPKTRAGAAAPDSVRQPERNPAAGDQRQGNGAGNQMGTGAGRGANRDSLKQSRGVGSLLLAVPMEDRFIGTANPGPVRSMTRTAERPQTAPSAPVAAGDRGARTGDSGRIVHRPTALHDQQLVRRYFRR